MQLRVQCSRCEPPELQNHPKGGIEILVNHVLSSWNQLIDEVLAINYALPETTGAMYIPAGTGT